MVFGTEEDARRVGEACRGRRQTRALRLEELALRLVHGMRRVLGAGEVAHDEAKIEAVEPRRLIGEAVDFVRRQAKAAHAGVQVDDGGPRIVIEAAPRPALDLAEIVQHRNQAVAFVGLFVAAQNAIQDGDVDLGLQRS